ALRGDVPGKSLRLDAEERQSDQEVVGEPVRPTDHLPRLVADPLPLGRVQVHPNEPEGASALAVVRELVQPSTAGHRLDNRLAILQDDEHVGVPRAVPDEPLTETDEPSEEATDSGQANGSGLHSHLLYGWVVVINRPGLFEYSR